MLTPVPPSLPNPVFDRMVDCYREASFALALTGAGISVESGIPDFRSEDGLWSRFPPEKYATLAAFLDDPEEAWVFYRSLHRTLEGCRPNAAHRALVDLERAGKLRAVITQNVDGLHSAAGSEIVVEVHGDSRRLQCLGCSTLYDVTGEHYRDGPIPRCPDCADPLKPNVVLFGEDVRCFEEVKGLVDECDLLLLIGTSAAVYPVAELPERIWVNGGSVLEFNLEETPVSAGAYLCTAVGCDRDGYLLKGKAGVTLRAFADAVLTGS